MDGGELLIFKTEAAAELARLLRRHGVGVSISEARRGVILEDKLGPGQNTVLTKLTLDYILSNSVLRPGVLEDIRALLKACDPAFVNFTARPDGNTALHLAARAGVSELVHLFLSERPTEERIFNAQGRRPADLAPSEEVRALFKGATARITDVLSEQQSGASDETEVRPRYASVCTAVCRKSLPLLGLVCSE